jgi:hypothetical protein
LLLNPERMMQIVNWFLGHATADASLSGKLGKLFAFFTDGRAVMKECATTHCEVAEMFARRLGFNEATQQTVRYLYEQWNGKGMVYGARAAAIPTTARVLHLAQAVEVANRFGDTAAADALARERRGTDFDPALVDAFLDASGAPAFWAPSRRRTWKPSVRRWRTSPTSRRCRAGTTRRRLPTSPRR